MKAFPIPVVALGPGTQTEDESLDYLPMPKDMDTYRPPVLPEPDELAGCDAARAVLDQVIALLDRTAERGPGEANDGAQPFNVFSAEASP